MADLPESQAPGAPMKNKLSDLNDHLFAQLERLSEEGLSPEKIAAEILEPHANPLLAEGEGNQWRNQLPKIES
mgnify:CR=1 FL=1